MANPRATRIFNYLTFLRSTSLERPHLAHYHSEDSEIHREANNSQFCCQPKKKVVIPIVEMSDEADPSDNCSRSWPKLPYPVPNNGWALITSHATAMAFFRYSTVSCRRENKVGSYQDSCEVKPPTANTNTTPTSPKRTFTPPARRLIQATNNRPLPNASHAPRV